MKILIAEDETDLNAVIVKKLRSEGFSVESCFDGEDALEHLQYMDYDVAVLDIMMPKMDGIGVVQKLRASGKNTPIIFLTAKDTVSDKVRGLNIGANDYLVKPFSFEELIARIMAVTRTAAGIVSSILKLDTLTLDTESHIVRRDNAEITLTGKEYNLLEYLLINKNKILSREKILNHVWGYDYDGGEKIVDVYMNYLRKKIDENAEVKLLHTVRGIGYVMRIQP
ncbi:MAG: response regulator transcription factor [Oscillospiraceae bacterium]|nr:response regulator transcription factor [Oscillospiraceae bacterium]